MSVKRKGQENHSISICIWIQIIFCFIFLVVLTSAVLKSKLYFKDTENARLNSDSLYDENSLYNVTKLDCGGSIRVPQVGNSVILDYKSKHMYSNNENCFWILNTAVGNVRYQVQIKVTLLYEGFGDTEDTLAILKWEDWDSLTPYPLVKEGDIFAPTSASNWLYLSFSTNEVVNGKGFMIQLETISVAKGFRGSNWAFNRSSGLFGYGPIKQSNRMAIVISPKSSSSNATAVRDVKVTIDSRAGLNGSCNFNDSLFVFSIGLRGKTTTEARLCGKSDTVVHIDRPIWIGFITSEASNATGFTIKWIDCTHSLF